MHSAELSSVGVVGLGYVGLPLAVCFAEAGLRVVGVDHSSHVVEGLQRSRSHIEDVADDRLAAVAGSLSFSTSSAALAEVAHPNTVPLW
jgi:UDP-N-acetyl-D-glucosamine dehydrogenase